MSERVTGCMRCCKFLLFIFIFFFWLMGCAIVGLSLYLFFNDTLDQLMPILESVDDTSILYYDYICYGMMGVGGFIMIVGFMGCAGAIYESKCLLCMFFTILTVLMIIEVAGSTLLYIFKDSVKEACTDDLMLVVENYNNISTQSKWDTFQETYQCCGASAAEDYVTYGLEVPVSCCSDVINCHESTAYSQGCDEVLFDIVSVEMSLCGWVVFAIGCATFLGIVFSCCLCCALRRIEYD